MDQVAERVDHGRIGVSFELRVALGQRAGERKRNSTRRGSGGQLQGDNDDAEGGMIGRPSSSSSAMEENKSN